MNTIDHSEINRICVYPTASETAQAVADEIISLVKRNPQAAITYPTGETPIPIYSAISKMVAGAEVDFSLSKAFHLDEYYPCDPTESFSFVKYLHEYVFNPFKIPLAQQFTIDGTVKDGRTEALRYEKILQQQMIHLAMLGLGPGGHIGFNERNTPITSRTHVSQLSEETIYRDHVLRNLKTPQKGITQGIATILDAERIFLVAYGKAKGEILKEALYGKITSWCPASALRLDGRKVTIFVDEEAAETLTS